jgi:hypothetical protein
MSGFFGNMMVALQNSISSTSASAATNANTPTITASVSGGRGTYTYLWDQSGTICTIPFPGASSTYFSNPVSAGTTIVYCQTTDSITGNMIYTPTCTITWTAVVSQSVVISGTVTYNGLAQAYTLTGTPATPAPSGTPASFTNAGTYVYPTNITSITPGSGYTLGTVTGSFVINKETITGTQASPSLVYNGATQNGTVITNVLPNGATFTGSVTASGLNAGTYTSSIAGSVNYQGTVNGGTFTITPVSITAMSFTLDGVAFTTPQTRTAGTSYTIAVSSATSTVPGATYSPTTLVVSTVGTWQLSSSGTVNYTGGPFTSPVLTLTAPTQSVVISGTVTYNGLAQAYTLTGTPATPAPSGTPASFTNAGTYVYPTNITSITPGSGYTLGTVTGSFVINKVTITGTPASPSLVYNGASQSATVISVVQPGGATYTGSVLATGTNAGTYTSSITGSGNYQGTVPGGTFTITRQSITAMSFTLNGVAFTTAQSRTAGTSYTIAVSATTPAGATSTPTSTTVSTAGSYSLTSAGSGNYQGSFTSPVLTLTAPTPTASITVGSPITTYRTNCTANLSNATATGYAWARVSGTTCTFAPSTAQTTQVTAPTNTQPGASTTVRCTITYSGGSLAPTANVPWGLV